MADEKRYSLNDIFSILHECTQILNNPVTVVAEDESGKQNYTNMTMSEFIAMSVGHEMTWDMSRLTTGDGTTMAKKDEVMEAMKENYFDEVAYPVYENFGLIQPRRGGKRKTRRLHR
uniref:Uncharacterized protein n=1 Tax=viral metagenome TaxID=1070528 RepID=A0A6C0KZ53_9ZZZZ